MHIAIIVGIVFAVLLIGVIVMRVALIRKKTQPVKFDPSSTEQPRFGLATSDQSDRLPARAMENYMKERDPLTYYWWAQQVHRFDQLPVVTPETIPFLFETLQAQAMRKRSYWDRFVIQDGEYGHLDYKLVKCHMLQEVELTGRHEMDHEMETTCPFEDSSLIQWGAQYVEGWTSAPGYPYHLGYGCVVKNQQLTNQQRIIEPKYKTYMGHFGHRMIRWGSRMVISAPGEGDQKWGEGRIYIYPLEESKDHELVEVLHQPEACFLGLDLAVDGEDTLYLLGLDAATLSTIQLWKYSADGSGWDLMSSCKGPKLGNDESDTPPVRLK